VEVRPFIQHYDQKQTSENRQEFAEPIITNLTKEALSSLNAEEKKTVRLINKEIVSFAHCSKDPKWIQFSRLFSQQVTPSSSESFIKKPIYKEATDEEIDWLFALEEWEHYPTLESPQANSEAVERIRSFIRGETAILNLQDLGLSSLPTCLFTNKNFAKTLIDGNPLKTFPKDLTIGAIQNGDLFDQMRSIIEARLQQEHKAKEFLQVQKTLYEEIVQLINKLSLPASIEEEKVFCLIENFRNLKRVLDPNLRQEFIRLITILEKMGYTKACHSAYETYHEVICHPKSVSPPVKTVKEELEASDLLEQLSKTCLEDGEQKLPITYRITLSEAIKEYTICKKSSIYVTISCLSAALNALNAIKNLPHQELDLHTKIAIIECCSITPPYSFRDDSDSVINSMNRLLKQDNNANFFVLSPEGLYETLDHLVCENPKELSRLLRSKKIKEIFTRKCKTSFSKYENLPKELLDLLFYRDLTTPQAKKENPNLEKIRSLSGLSMQHVIALIDKVSIHQPNLESLPELLSLLNMEVAHANRFEYFTCYPPQKHLLSWLNTYRGKNLDAFSGYIRDQKTLLRENFSLHKELIIRGTGMAFSPWNRGYEESGFTEILRVYITEHPNIAIEASALLERDPEEKKRLFDQSPEFSLFFEPENYQENSSFFLQEMIAKILLKYPDPHLRKTLLRWIAYAEIARKTLPPLPGSEEIEKKILEEIEAIRSPTLHYLLTKQLFSLLHFEKQKEYFTSSELEKIAHFKKRDLIWKLLITPFLIQEEGNKLTDFIQLLQKSYFKDAARSYAIMETLCLLIETKELSPKEKIHLLSMSVEPGKIKEAGAKLESNLLLIKCFLLNEWTHDLKIGKDFSDIKKCLQDRFSVITGIDDIDNIEEKYAKTFALFRDPLAIFAYASKLREEFSRKRGDEKVLLALKRYVEATLNNTLRHERYNEEPNEHLNTIFKSKKGFRENWILGETLFLSDLITEDTSKNGIDVKKFLQDRIMDGHIAKELINTLAEYLEGKITIETAEKRLDPYHEGLVYWDLQKALLSLLNENLSQKEKVSLFTNSVEPLILLLPENQFKKDLHDLGKLLSASQEKVSTKEWTVVDTDNGEDLQACGEEVLGSCQSIDSATEYNQCLLSYLLDGKNRLIAVKNANGKIVTRCIIRVLWDDKDKKPVLFQERAYQAAGAPQKALIALDLMAKKRAKELDIPLVSTSYIHKLYSLNTKAPFEYVDALGGITNGTYEIE
jgi:hypothetical protein